MIDLMRALREHAGYGQRLAGFLPAFLITELFYKFHSFTLECLAFLLTWLVCDWLVETVVGRPRREVVDS